DQDDERSDDDPDGVTACVAGLRAARNVARGSGAMSDAVYGAVDGIDVDNFPEDARGEREERFDDCRAVDFINGIFVVKRVVDGLERSRDFSGLARLLQIEPEGDAEAHQSGGDGDNSENYFKIVSFSSTFMNCAEDRSKECREVIFAAPEGWNGHPAADDAEDGEHDKRPEHVPPRFVHV